MSAVNGEASTSGDSLPRRAEFVRDREADGSKPLLVLDVHPNSTVRGRFIDESDSLLLDAFPDADPGDRVVTVAYMTEIDAKLSMKDIAGAADLAEAAENAGVYTYDYPAGRLTNVHRDDRLIADGGQQYQLPQLGEFVEDERKDDGEKLIVLNVHPTATAKGWYIDEEDASLAELNWEYDPMAPVVTIAYAGEFANKITLREIATEQEAIEAAENAGVKTYDFPAPRLKSAEGDSR